VVCRPELLELLGDHLSFAALPRLDLRLPDRRYSYVSVVKGVLEESQPASIPNAEAGYLAIDRLIERCKEGRERRGS